MKSMPVLAWLAAMAALTFSPPADAQSRAPHNRATYEKLVTIHAQANNVPEALVHRVIVRESKYQPDLVGRGGTIGLMQIKLATARGLGYTGDAAGLHDPDTNLAYGIKYLAGAWRAAEGNHTRAMHLYASGYYYVAKRQRLEQRRQPEPVLARAPPKEAEPPAEAAEPKRAAAKPAARKPMALTPAMVLTPALAKPKSKARARSKKLAAAKGRVPRPPARIPRGANATKPR